MDPIDALLLGLTMAALTTAIGLVLAFQLWAPRSLRAELLTIIGLLLLAVLLYSFL